MSDSTQLSPRKIWQQQDVECCTSCAIATCLEALHREYDVLSPIFHYQRSGARYAALPSELGGKAFTHDLKYYQASGALMGYTLASKPVIDEGAIGSSGGSANELLDALNKQREAESGAGFDALKRETDTVELLLKKQKACLELSTPPAECEDL